jgi:hypothetical protein
VYEINYQEVITMTNIGRIVEISTQRLENLRKDIAKYEEHVNKCDIVGTNILAESIGSDIDFLKYSVAKKTTEEQKREMKQLENLFAGHMTRLQKCICVKKVEK